MDTIIYETRHTLLMRDCDRFRRLKPSVILSMFQDCSEALTEGWGVGLEAMLRQGIIWVAAKVGCTVTRLPEHGETVTVRGWAGRGRSGIFPFHYMVLGEDGAPCVEGCSMWVLSDPAAHSMLSERVPKIQLPTPEPEGTPLPRMQPIRPMTAPKTQARRVRFSEVDINGHLTNTRYMDWVCDLAEADFHRDHPITGMRIDYRAEIFPDEEVVLEWEQTDERLCCSCKGRFQAMLTF